MRGSPRHGVTTHNWFVHYLWDIYGGFGHNGKIIQRTLPSHTQPSPSKLRLPGSVFETSRTSEEKHVRESPRHGVTTHNWYVHYLWDIYGGFVHNGKIIQRTFPSHTQPSLSKFDCLGRFSKVHTLRRRNMCVKVPDVVLPPITGLLITLWTYMVTDSMSESY